MTPDPGTGANQAPVRTVGPTSPLTPREGKHSRELGSFEPELGGCLQEVTLAYETWGELNAPGTNAVLITHALTGDSHAAGPVSEGYHRGGWWEPVVGPGRMVDTDEHFVVCSNVLGGCSGSTGPASTDSESGRPYGARFPVVTIRDMVRAQKRLLDSLGVKRLEAVIGGSIGGQQALEWAVEYPDFVGKAIPVAATGALGPQGIAMSEIGRRAIMSDPDWQNGDYYETGKSPDAGLSIARMAGMVTYQSAASKWERFSRRLATRPALETEFGGRFEVESYLHYQGRELAGRFDANSYLYLSRAMDLYDVAAGYASEEEAYSRIQSPVLFVGISSDWLFPPGEVRGAAEKARNAGVDASYVEIKSINGHDTFLKDWDELEAAVGPFLKS